MNLLQSGDNFIRRGSAMQQSSKSGLLASDSLGYRVWKVRCTGPSRPIAWNELPAECVAIESVDGGALRSDEAREFLAGFNETSLTQRGMRTDSDTIWAVAVPVEVAFRGDLAPGDRLSAADLRLP
jgi:hypothetical protein